MKKKLATVWLSGCSGCHMSLLDIDERLLELAKIVDIVKSPIVDAKEFPPCDLVLIEGAVALDEHAHELKKIRERAKIVVALGDCAATGNVPSLRNSFTKEAVFKRAYLEAESNVAGDLPRSPEIAAMLSKVRPLHELIKVDYFLPGCPPPADQIFHLLSELAQNRAPHLDKTSMNYG